MIWWSSASLLVKGVFVVSYLVLLYVAALLNWKMAIIFSPFAYRLGHSPDVSLPDDRITDYAMLAFLIWPFFVAYVIIAWSCLMISRTVKLMFVPVTTNATRYAALGRDLLERISDK